MTIGEDLRTELISTLTSTTVGNQVFQNKVPRATRTNFPRIWFMRVSEDEELTLDGGGGLLDSTFDLEVHDTDIDSAIDLANEIKRKPPDGLHGKRGTFGDSAVKGVFVSDQDDDYVAKGTGNDVGIHVAALSVRIFHSG